MALYKCIYLQSAVTKPQVMLRLFFSSSNTCIAQRSLSYACIRSLSIIFIP